MFNTNKFEQTTFAQRTADVKVDDLKDFFDKDSDLVWKVRGLSSTEMAIAQESASKNKNILSVIEAISGKNQSDKVDALKELLGTSENVPIDLAKRMEHLVQGSIEPQIDLSLSVKLAQHFPIIFMLLTNKILELTGLGSIDSAKLKASTQKAK